jgi:hypothetical protein
MSNIELGSNMWRGYTNLERLSYQNYRINHRTNFVDPEDSRVHTQTIERLWRDVKEHIYLSVNNFELLKNK